MPQAATPGLLIYIYIYIAPSPKGGLSEPVRPSGKALGW